MRDSSHTTRLSATRGKTHQACRGRTVIGLQRDCTSVRTNDLSSWHAKPVVVRCPPRTHDCAKISPKLRRITGRDKCRHLCPEQKKHVIGLAQPASVRPPKPKFGAQPAD